MNNRNAPRTAAFHALIVAAGTGSRFGGDIPKQYRSLAGKPVLRHSLDTFLGMPGLKSLTVVISPAHLALYRQAVEGLDLAAPVKGGKERKDSVYNGLVSISDIEDKEIILIHDAARPLVREKDIVALLHAMETHQAATLACPVADTLRYADENGKAAAAIDRSGLWAIQTPQAFRYGILRQAHEAASPGAIYTDDTALASAHGIAVGFVVGHKSNFKITETGDIILAEAVLSAHSDIRTGTGFDVHPFDDLSRDVHAIRLCGVDVPHDEKLKGHSDADVGLHALTDALLGAIGAGDIGMLFPPSDPAFKDMDSAVFLRKALELVRNRGGRINNVDITLICEEPKIGPHREAIVARIAGLLEIAPDRVNVKATTTERLGFTGRQEGIAAQAVATVSLPGKGDV